MNAELWAYAGIGLVVLEAIIAGIGLMCILRGLTYRGGERR